MNGDAVVIGAGVMGSSIALELARSGRRVVVVDKAGVVGHGSTGASSAIMRFNFSTFSGVATSWESKFHWENWAEHLGADGENLVEYVRSGVVFIDVELAPVRSTCRCSTASAFPTSSGMPTGSPSASPASTRDATGRPSGWRIHGSGTTRASGSAPSTPPTAATCPTRNWQR